VRTSAVLSDEAYGEVGSGHAKADTPCNFYNIKYSKSAVALAKADYYRNILSDMRDFDNEKYSKIEICYEKYEMRKNLKIIVISFLFEAVQGGIPWF
jgi:hypothetical protein